MNTLTRHNTWLAIAIAVLFAACDGSSVIADMPDAWSEISDAATSPDAVPPDDIPRDDGIDPVQVVQTLSPANQCPQLTVTPGVVVTTATSASGFKFRLACTPAGMPIGATLIRADVVTKGGPMDIKLLATGLPVLMPSGGLRSESSVDSEGVAVTSFDGPLGEGANGYLPMVVIQADLNVNVGEATVLGVLWTWSYDLGQEPQTLDAALLALQDPV